MRKNPFLQYGLVLLLLMGVAFLYSCKKGEKAEPQITSKQVEEYLTGYYKAKYSVITSNESGSAIQQYLDFTDKGVWTTNKVNFLMEERLAYANEGDRMQDVQIKVSVDSILRRQSDSISVKVTEDLSYRSNALDAETDEPIITQMENHYIVNISTKDTKKWLITEERPTDLIPVDQSKLEALLSRVLAGNGIGSYGAVGTNGTYSGKVAALYGILNAKLPTTPCSVVFNIVGADCTNFVSLCLEAGGWQYDSQWNKKPAYSGFSKAWGGANHFYKYISTSNRIIP